MLNAGFRLRWRRAGVLCVLLSAAGAMAQASFTRGPTPWPELPAPPKAKVEWVSDDMRLNGVPMRIQRFESEASKEEVVAYYAAYWQTSQSPAQPGKTSASVTPKGPDTLVARVTGPFYSMVKVRSAGGGSEGTISTSLLGGTEPTLDTAGVPAPASAKAANVVEAIDNGKRNKQVLFLSRDSMTSVAAWYANALRASGWTLLQENAAPASEGKPAGLVRMYSRKSQQLDVALGQDPAAGLTLINANLVTTGAIP